MLLLLQEGERAAWRKKLIVIANQLYTFYEETRFTVSFNIVYRLISMINIYIFFYFIHAVIWILIHEWSDRRAVTTCSDRCAVTTCSDNVQWQMCSDNVQWQMCIDRRAVRGVQCNIRTIYVIRRPKWKCETKNSSKERVFNQLFGERSNFNKQEKTLIKILSKVCWSRFTIGQPSMSRLRHGKVTCLQVFLLCWKFNYG